MGKEKEENIWRMKILFTEEKEEKKEKEEKEEKENCCGWDGTDGWTGIEGSHKIQCVPNI